MRKIIFITCIVSLLVVLNTCVVIAEDKHVSTYHDRHPVRCQSSLWAQRYLRNDNERLELEKEEHDLRMEYLELLVAKEQQESDLNRGRQGSTIGLTRSERRRNYLRGRRSIGR